MVIAYNFTHHAVIVCIFFERPVECWLKETQLDLVPVDKKGTIAHQLDAEAWNRAVEAQRIKIQTVLKKLADYRSKPLGI